MKNSDDSSGRDSRLLKLLISAMSLVALAGCCHCPPATGNGQPYMGPTEPMARVVAQINSNNEKIPSLWSSLYYKANIIDDKKQAHFVNGEGTLLYRQSMDLRLIGRKDPAGTIFDIGSNSNQFWLRVIPELDTMWWGTYRTLENVDPDHLGIPIRPDLVLSVLAISPIDTNFRQQPAPVMRFDSQQRAYVLLWVAPLPDRWIALREVWYDMNTLHPKLVLLYDQNGRVALRADLGLFKQIEVAGQPKEKWPWIAGDYKLAFPETGSTMELTLSDDSVLRHGALPMDKSFAMPSPDNADVSHVIEVGKTQSR